MFQQVREGKTAADDAEKQTHRKTTPRHPKPLLQKVRCGGKKKKTYMNFAVENNLTVRGRKGRAAPTHAPRALCSDVIMAAMGGK